MFALMYYGGFALAIALFVLAVLFFIIFRVPSIHRYFRRNSRKGLVQAEAVNVVKAQTEGPKRVTRAEYENRTEIITLSHEKTDSIDPEKTDYMTTGQIKTTSGDKGKESDVGTEILE